MPLVSGRDAANRPVRSAKLKICRRRFDRYSRMLARNNDSSRLYLRLSRGITRDRDLLNLASRSPDGGDPNLFLGAVHFLLLKGVKHRLRNYYPSLSPVQPPSDPVPAFRSFCLEHASEILRLLRTRSVQTNEVGRCSALFPALHVVSKMGNDKPLVVLDLGTSAGLNLMWDCYEYDYGLARRYGDENASVRLRCRLVGTVTPSLAPDSPTVASRTGVDIHPVNLTSPNDVLWLRALVWPENVEREKMLLKAVRVVRQHNPRTIKGDMIRALPRLLEDLPLEGTAAVICSFVLRQLSLSSRERFFQILRLHSWNRTLFLIVLDSLDKSFATLHLIIFRTGEITRITLAECDYHGTWLRWLYKSIRTF